MAQPIRQVLYPEVDFNDTRPYAFALTYDKVREGAGHLVLHSHKTGLIGMQVSGGYFGVELASEHMAVPVNTAVWVPPDVPPARHSAIRAPRSAFTWRLKWQKRFCRTIRYDGWLTASRAK